MNLISMADIHGDFETFDKALSYIKHSKADVLAISGDLCGNVIAKEEQPAMIQTNSEIDSIMQFLNQTYRVPLDFDSAKSFVSGTANNRAMFGESFDAYEKFKDKARANAIAQYKEFKDRFKSLKQKVVLVPGNWDLPCIDDILAEENIHCKHPNPEKIRGIQFAGYGGARLTAPEGFEMPFWSTFQFNEEEFDYGIGKCYAHPKLYKDPEVILTHTAPLHFADERHPGEKILLDYMHARAPSLILTGHTHKISIAEENSLKSGTFVINPGNLGRYKDQDFGTFIEIEIDKNLFVHPRQLIQVKGNETNIYTLHAPTSQ